MTDETPIQRYTRVSKTGSRKLLHSHDLQDDTLTRMGQHFTLPLTVARISDTDKSGKDFNREGWNKVMELLANGQIRGVAVATLDRFARDISEGFAMLKRIQTLGGELWVDDTGGKVDLHDDASLMNFAMRLVIGHIEYQRKAAGLNQSRENAIAAGRHVPHTFGYDITDEVVMVNNRRQRAPQRVNEKEAATVKYAFELRAYGFPDDEEKTPLGWITIANALNADDDHKLPDGLWTWERVRRMVKSKTYLGIAKSGKFKNPDAHDPIVTPELYAAANLVRRGAKRAEPSPWLLNGLLRCGACGYRMQSDPVKSRGKTFRYYKCVRNHKAGKCPIPVGSLNADEAEAYIWESSKRALSRRVYVGADANGSHAEDEAYNAAKRRWQFTYDRLEQAHADGVSTDELIELERREKDAKGKLRTALVNRNRARDIRAGLANVPEDPETLTLRQRQKLIRAMYPAIFARRARTHGEAIPDRIELREHAPAGLSSRTVRQAPIRSYFV